MNFKVKFIEQLVSANTLGELIEKMDKHKDAVPFTIENDNGVTIAKWSKHDGIIIYNTTLLNSETSKEGS